MPKLGHYVEIVNDKVAHSAIGSWFRLEAPRSLRPRQRYGSRFTTELRAGITTFAAMAYILAVNASILSDTGGTCVCPGNADDPVCDNDSAYLECVNLVRRDLVTATAAVSCLASFCMGLFANLPLGLAPGMGLNAYFTYQVVGYHGTGLVSYRQALSAVFIEGLLFVALAVLGLRQWLARAIPASLKAATGAGIGLYLTFIGLKSGAGIGVIGPDASDLVALAGCPTQYQDPETGECLSHVLQDGKVWIGIFCGGIFIVLLLMYRVRGAFLAGILLVSITAWPRPTSVTLFPYTESGDSNFNFFKQVVAFHPIRKTLNVFEWDASSGQFWIALITFLYVDIMDTTGTLYAMASYAGLVDDDTKDFEGSAMAYVTDAFSITIGSIFGVSPVTAYIESGSGIEDGGKTGITGMTIGICFFISIFFAPIFASIPTWATGGTLVIVGSMMMRSAATINWNYYGDSVPAFLTIALMPFSYSIAYGLIAGICAYICINGFVYILAHVTRGRITPRNYEQREYWTYRVKGGLLPQWVRRAARGDKRFWQDPEFRQPAVEARSGTVTPRADGEEALGADVSGGEKAMGRVASTLKSADQ